MVKRKRYILLAGVMLVSLLTGCGDGSEEALNETSSAYGMPEAVQMETTPVLAQPEQEAAEIKVLYQTGKLTEEEEAGVLDAMQTLYQNLEVEEYLGESIHMVCGEEWFETMTPGLYEGCRSYILQQGDKVLLSVQVGYDIAGNAYSNVFFQTDENSLILLKQSGSKVSLMQAAVSGGEYDGAFVTWQIDSALGEIKKEQGTYSKGVLVGEYSVSVYRGAAGDAFDLWTNRENMTYETNTITYDEQGQPVATATPEPTVAPTNTPTPTKKPVVNQTPTPTQAPTQAPVQQPDDDDDDDDDDDGSGGGGSDSGSDGGDSSPATGGDTDIEWSPDLM